MYNPAYSSTPWAQIGKHTYYTPGLVLKTWVPGERIIIGKFCSIADQVVIFTGGMRRTDTAALYPFDARRAYRTTEHTTIGNDVWIGYHATIVGGVTVGDGAVIASHSVVFSDVPAFAVVAGNPAEIVRYRFSRGIVERLLRIAWWDWPDWKITANMDWFDRPIREFVDQFDPQPGDADVDPQPEDAHVDPQPGDAHVDPQPDAGHD